jgi:putative transposase
MTRLLGWAPKGRRLIDKVPHGHWKTATFLAALRNDRIEAPRLFDGPINGERFLAYVEAAGARLLFLPKYSPDLNPIEQLFSKVKTLVRKAAPRSLDAVSDAIANALAAVSHAECANYFANSGYAHD